MSGGNSFGPMQQMGGYGQPFQFGMSPMGGGMRRGISSMPQMNMSQMNMSPMGGSQAFGSDRQFSGYQQPFGGFQQPFNFQQFRPMFGGFQSFNSPYMSPFQQPMQQPGQQGVPSPYDLPTRGQGMNYGGVRAAPSDTGGIRAAKPEFETPMTPRDYATQPGFFDPSIYAMGGM